MAIGHLHKRGRVWYARYKDQSGKLRWKSLETNSKEIADAKLNKLKEALEKHELGWRLAPKPIQKYLEEYLSICGVEHSKRTYRVEKQVLNEFIKFTGVCKRQRECPRFGQGWGGWVFELLVFLF